MVVHLLMTAGCFKVPNRIWGRSVPRRRCKPLIAACYQKAANTFPGFRSGQKWRVVGSFVVLCRCCHGENIKFALRVWLSFRLEIAKMGWLVGWRRPVRMLCNSVCRHFSGGTINLSTVLIKLHCRPRQQQQYVAPTHSLSLCPLSLNLKLAAKFPGSLS